MPIDFESEPLGRKIGITEHQKMIAKLTKEQTEILNAANDGSDLDHIRLAEIVKEIEYRNLQISRLRGDGPDKIIAP
ncbi:TPA: hypothetical protein ACQQWR_002519 [Yersinia enterocolitica]|nr:hypothetical protein [Yersinia enterocolitica]EKN4111934.1 hypothetical protein [Yersinia enterocolitica]EKN5122704.1 hypothetical protein [Yersinia enterocolitica]ELI7978683.1 hypothetical protein [Yersinia enterocolitica]HEI6940583.1 hypothetical protein [Yersinia enterocolitica]